MRLGWVLSVLFFVVAVRMQACNGCLKKERIGLLEIKAYFLALGDDYTEWALASWVEDRGSNCCAWEGVKCSNISTGHVSDLSLNRLLPFYNEKTWMLNVSLLRPFEELLSLDLSWNNFKGWSNNEGFPWLKKLETLHLSFNALNGSILPSFSGLTSLRTLNLGVNRINDSFPAEGFPRLEKLETLDLSSNQLNGSIFGELNGLTSLRKLILNSNEIPSLSPQDFVNLTQLELLDLSYNLLRGSLNAKDFQNLSNLTMLDLSDNTLNSSIQGLCEMKNLIELALINNRLSGQLPECLSILTNLQVLDLSNNMFSGKFPSFLRNLTSLVHLSLFGNYLEGSFSLSTLANHSKLQVLYISSQSPKAQVDTEKAQWFPTFQLRSLIIQCCNLNMNKAGIIPSFLLYQRDLQFIDLSNNKLRGAFPNWLFQNNSRLETIILKNNSLEGKLQLYSIMQDMHSMDVSNNKISGMLPKDFGDFLPNIMILNLSVNNFEGGIPASIGKMEKLTLLDLSHNHLSGRLPKELARGCIELDTLKLSNNFLLGNVPTSFKSERLARLYLNNNNFSGTLNEVLANNTCLVVLDISNNSISGAIPSSIGKFVSLEFLLMAENKLEGQIPFEFTNMSNLKIVDLSQNNLSGLISYFNLSSIKYLYLQKNALSGHIPLAFAENLQLVVLDLRDNNFSGNVPSWMDKLSNLRVLLLGGNKFHGQIPIQLCKLKHVTIMDLSRNMIHGTIPSCFTNLSFGVEHDDGGHFQDQISKHYGSFLESTNASVSVYHPRTIDLQYDDEAIAIAEFRTKGNYYSYKGSILENMTGLDLSCNELRGNIPFQIGNLQQIHALNLSHNYLSSSIPETFSSLKQIESLDLSFNNLSGQIPFELAQLNFLSKFNVSFNNLSGIAPSTGQFATFDEESYKGNPGLCGPLLKHKCDKDFVISPPSQFNNTEEKDTIVEMVAFGWSFFASYITILLGFVTVLCINPQWRMAWFHYIGYDINGYDIYGIDHSVVPPSTSTAAALIDFSYARNCGQE